MFLDRRIPFPAATLLVALPVLSLLQVELAAQSIKLNGPLARQRAGDVTDYVLSTDGTRVVYRADQAQDYVFEIFSGPVDGSAPPIRLNAPLPSGGSVIDGPRSAAGRIVYVADQRTAGVSELYSVPADGSAAPLRLSGDLVTNGDVGAFWIGSDEAYAVYLADAFVHGVLHLFRVPVDGSAPALDLTPGLDISGYYFGSGAWLSPDGSSAVFTTSDSSSTTLHAVPTDGSAAPVTLDVTSASCFCVAYFDDVRFSADDRSIVYADYVDHDGPLDVDLYSVPVDGSRAPVRLSPYTLDGYAMEFAYGGEERVVFHDGSSSGPLLTDLHSVRTDGTDLVPLCPAGWHTDFGFGGRAYFSADADEVVLLAHDSLHRAIFRFDGSTLATLFGPGDFGLCFLDVLGPAVLTVGVANSMTALLALPVAGGAPPVTLSPLESCSLGAVPALTPDGQELVFVGPRAAASVSELYAVPFDGSEPARQLSAPLIPTGDVRSFRITPDGARVVYAADQEGDETIELYGTRLDGTEFPFKYNPALAWGPQLGDVLAFRVASNGARVVYLADETTDQVFDLYAMKSDGRGAPRRLTEALGESGDVLSDFVFTPSGQRIVFQYFASPPQYRLYSVPTALVQPPVLLDSSSLSFPAPLAVTPDGARLVYTKALGSSDHALCSAVIDASTPPVTLADPAGSQSVSEFQLAPSGDAVVYLADQDVPLESELYRIASDGSTTAQKLSGPLVANGDVDAFQIGPDGARVVYRADQDADEVSELFSVPSDGSAAAVKLNGPLAASGNVREFAIGSDALRVVYRASAVASAQFELFSVPTDGSGAALRLTVLPSGRRVRPDFQISPDGQQVFYRANPTRPATDELFAVPIDGSASPVTLSGTLVQGRTVSAFAVSPDHSRLVYLADQTQYRVFELFSVPSDGSAPAIALDPLPAYADVTAFRIDPDSLRVVYTADRGTDGVLELFTVALDGSSPPERVNRDLPPGAAVEADFVTLPGGGVLYRADQDVNDVVELYHFLDLDPDKRLPSGAPTRSVTVVR